jgi:hypothetical protein
MEFILGLINFRVFDFSMQYQNDVLSNIVSFLGFEFDYLRIILTVAGIAELVQLYNLTLSV